MSRIRNTNNETELRFFELLRESKIRFSTHGKDLPGRPDVVIRRYKIAVFVDGDFWHGRRFNEWGHKLKPEWLEKIERNIKRDQRQRRLLRSMGWSVLRIWTSDLPKHRQRCVKRIERTIQKRASRTK